MTALSTRPRSQRQGNAPRAASPPPPPRALCYGLTVLLSAFLLFLVQPLIARWILPWFGGGSGVWSACLLFFQGALILGYAYAFALAKWLTPRLQAIVHLLVLALTALLLPMTPAPSSQPGPATEPVGAILLLLLQSVGAPYVALATTGPLLQSWFASSFPGRSPYRLYALSNIGSLLALPAYPLLVEPWLGRSQQTVAWSIAYGAFVLAAGWCAVSLLRAPAPLLAPREASSERLPWNRPLLWFLLSACSSVMLVASTAVISDEALPAPFLWVVPLGIYLFTFVATFQWPWLYRRAVFVPLLLLAAWPVVDAPLEGDRDLMVMVLRHCALVFAACMVCHGELYRLRPPAWRLTAFYLLMAIGGAAGAAFVTLLGPRWFDSYAEQPIALFATIALAATCLFRDPASPLRRGSKPALWVLLLLATGGLGFLLMSARETMQTGVVMQRRGFYGVLRVREVDRGPAGTLRELRHASTEHGSQFLNEPYRRMPTWYFAPGTGIGRLLTAMGRNRSLRTGVIGLGAGTLAAYGRPGDVIRFYEIDPGVKALAYGMFSYLADSRAKVEVVPGDGRLSLEAQPPQQYDVLVVDAFSGDAIPFHLLTREAIALYRRHLNPQGVIALHISNTWFDLEPVARALAVDAGLAFLFAHNPADPGRETWQSFWALLSPDRALLADPALAEVAVPPGQRTVRVWTDEHVRVLDALR